jgi:septal ring factor EnvC (AmiA/AmiB activator)
MTENDPFPASPREPIPPVIDHEPASVRSGVPRGAEPGPPPGSDRPPAPRAKSGGGGSVLLTLVLFLGRAGGLYYVWDNPKAEDGDGGVGALQRQVQAEEQASGQATAQLQGLTQQVQALADRVDKLEKTGGAQAGAAAAPAAADLGDLPKRVDELTAKVAALENQPAPQAAAALPPPAEAAAAPAPQDSAGDQQALAALSQKLDQVQASDKAALDQVQASDQAARSQLEAQQKALADQAAAEKQALDQAAAQKQALDDAQAALAQTKSALAHDQAALDQDQTTLAQLGDRLAKVEKGAGNVEDAATRATRLERIQAAVVALDAGQKLGEMPNAPPALAKFATQAPPTEAGLRDSFPALAAHAREVSQPDTAHKSFLQRAFARLQESVTVRQGNDVLVGDPAAGVLSDAEVKVQNGDLPGAVQRLQALHGPAAEAMQGWVDQAQSLIAARAALASLAARG